MKIQLDLTKHCIQTATRKKYNQLISAYFKLNRKKTPNDLPDDLPNDQIQTMESEIALLKDALETLDFARLRNTYPELQGGGPHAISISRATDAPITISINNRKIHATHQNNQLL